MSRRFQFSLANLLVFTLVAASACAVGRCVLAIALTIGPDALALVWVVPITYWYALLAASVYTATVPFLYWLVYWRKRPRFKPDGDEHRRTARADTEERYLISP